MPSLPPFDIKPLNAPLPVPQKSFSLFALGFRPFFLFGVLYSLLITAWWSHGFAAGQLAGNYYGAIFWHSHEMLFGFALAVISGFLLTATGNWTGRSMPERWTLAGIFGLWLAGRLVPLLDAYLPGALIAAVDLAFLPVLAWYVAKPIYEMHQRHNMIFPAMLFLMAAANLAYHAEALGWLSGSARAGQQAMLYLVLITILLVTGRVLPFFTRGAIPGAKPKIVPALEIAACVAVAVSALIEYFPLPVHLKAFAFLATAVLLLVRAGNWHHPKVWTIPLLWMLYLGYGWITAGFVLKIPAAYGRLLPSLATHALTAGGMGVIILGMIARVSLAHTGRPLKPSRWIILAFAVMNLAAVVRVILPAVHPAWYLECIMVSGVLWLIAFTLYLVIYTPMLLRPRADGQAG